jgi:hypothetical protein
LRRWLAAALLAAALAPVAGAANAEDMEWPEPIAWGEQINPARVAEAVRTALTNTRWQVEADSGLSLTARHQDGDRELRLRLDYGTQQVSYHYVDSQHYLYRHEDGRSYIHRRANRLMGKLDRAMRAEIQRMRFERNDDAEVVPVMPADEPAPDPEDERSP